MINKLKTFMKKQPLMLIIRIVIIALTITLLINFISSGKLYKSGLAIILFLTVLDIYKTITRR